LGRGFLSLSFAPISFSKKQAITVGGDAGVDVMCATANGYTSVASENPGFVVLRVSTNQLRRRFVTYEQTFATTRRRALKWRYIV
jgi:hypothetical protein